MEALSNLTNKQFYKLISKSDAELRTLLIEMGLLYSPDCGRPCIMENCDGRMNYRVHNGERFRCTKKNCRKEIGFYKETFFEHSHLTPKEILEFVWFWCNDTCSIEYCQQHFTRDDGSTISRQAIVDWRQFCRDIAVGYFERHPKILGGPGKTVEIDETVITKRKYNKGRVIDNYWFFGMVERESGEVMLVHVERRDENTLRPLIQKYILPGTTIISDLWASYGCISRLPEGYTHLTVNHSVNFVNPENDAHTNTIESEWQKFKSRHKKEYGTARTLILEYTAQHLWKKKFRNDNEYYRFWTTVKELYPLPN